MNETGRQETCPTICRWRCRHLSVVSWGDWAFAKRAQLYGQLCTTIWNVNSSRLRRCVLKPVASSFAWNQKVRPPLATLCVAGLWVPRLPMRIGPDGVGLIMVWAWKKWENNFHDESVIRCESSFVIIIRNAFISQFWIHSDTPCVQGGREQPRVIPGFSRVTACVSLSSPFLARSYWPDSSSPSSKKVLYI